MRDERTEPLLAFITALHAQTDRMLAQIQKKKHFSISPFTLFVFNQLNECRHFCLFLFFNKMFSNSSIRVFTTSIPVCVATVRWLRVKGDGGRQTRFGTCHSAPATKFRPWNSENRPGISGRVGHHIFLTMTS